MLNCIIPARSGSKRIKNKNIVNLFGRPLIEICITNLISMKLFENIYVSSDSDEILQISKEAGAKTPFIRAKRLSDDHTDTISVVKDAIEILNLSEEKKVACVYPAAILLKPSHITEAVRLSRANAGAFIIATQQYPSNVHRAFVKNSYGKITPLCPDILDARTQDIENHYFDAGQFYVADVKTWKNAKSIINHDNVCAVEMKSFESVDLDEENDLELLKALYAFSISQGE